MTMTDMSTISLTEKYRPESLDEVRGQDEIVEDLKDYVDDPSMPNLLFSGPAGTGKTAMAVALGKEKYGDDFKQNFYELNASDDRGINVVRDQIKSYAAQHPTPGYDHKIIFLDEADSLTRDAQSALRRIIENYHDRTRFILSCNYANKLLDPIQSRTSSYKVSPLEDEEMFGLLTDILDGEDVDYDEDDIDELVESARGDARRAINTLQAAVRDGELDSGKLDNLNDTVDWDVIEEIVEAAFEGDTDDAMNMMITDVVKQGADPESVAKAFMSIIRGYEDIPQDSKMKCLDMLGEVEYRILDGANPHIQWNSFIAKLSVAPYMSVGGYDG